MDTISPKVVAGTLGAAIATLIFALLAIAGYPPDPGLQGAITTIIVFVLGYLRIDPNRRAPRK